jgi:leader peptidase (prepilin peptidase)/N-methyltransferase
LTTLALGIAYRAGDGYLEELPRGTSYAVHTAEALAVRGIISAATAALVLLTLRWFYWMLRRHQGMGMGDVKLAAAIAAWLGARQVALALFTLMWYLNFFP